MSYKAASLSEEVLNIIRDKGTERPFSGEYEECEEPGTYLCRMCGLALFRSKAKFNAFCGWPSFDQEVLGNVAYKKDQDGVRTEALCIRCQGHLGHIFKGEKFTSLNTRYCINSASLDFINNTRVTDSEEAIVAAGCFWGVEYYFKKLPGVLKIESGYTGGTLKHPTYEQVCNGNTGHFEAVRVLYDPEIISYEKVIKYFFEIHDATQSNGQGPDIGDQYLSACFYHKESQKKIANTLIDELKHKGYDITTQVLPVSTFWPAEGYHQNHYQKSGQLPYCHIYKKLWNS